MQTRTAHRYLAVIWFAGTLILLVGIFLQSVIFQIYGEAAGSIWSWFKSSVIPIVSLMFGVGLAETLPRKVVDTKADPLLCGIVMIASVIYIAGLVVILALVGWQMSVYPINASGPYIDLFQGIMLVLIGVFFVRRFREPAPEPRTEDRHSPAQGN